MSVKRTNYQSGTPWEPLRGYSRCVVAGQHLYISGTTALGDDGEVIGGNDAYLQSRHVLDKIISFAHQAGFETRDIVLTRIYITDMKSWTEISRAHSEVFDKVRPASSLVEVSKLRDPRLLIEVEAQGIKDCSDPDWKKLKSK